MRGIFLGIGSNLGDREFHLAEACRLIDLLPETKIIQCSSMLETEPWGLTDQPSFKNMVIEINSNLTPEKLLENLLQIEDKMGRVRTVKWGPRIIDIDILFYNQTIIETDRLQIPHPYLPEREFVLEPFVEIAPDFKHPITGIKISEYLKIIKMEKL